MLFELFLPTTVQLIIDSWFYIGFGNSKFNCRTSFIKTRGLYILKQPFEGPKKNLRFFFRKLLAVCTVSTPEWVMSAHVQYLYVCTYKLKIIFLPIKYLSKCFFIRTNSCVSLLYASHTHFVPPPYKKRTSKTNWSKRAFTVAMLPKIWQKNKTQLQYPKSFFISSPVRYFYCCSAQHIQFTFGLIY